MGRDSVVLRKGGAGWLTTSDGRFVVRRQGTSWTVAERSGARVFATPGGPRQESAERKDLKGVRLLIFLVRAEEAYRTRKKAA
jgi:hypothetical protein